MIMVRSIDKDDIAEAIVPYVNQCARVYLGIRTNWDERGWFPFRTVKDVEHTIYELLDGGYDSIDQSQTGRLHSTIETTGISVSLTLHPLTQQYTLDPTAPFAYSEVTIQFVIAPCSYNMLYPSEDDVL